MQRDCTAFSIFPHHLRLHGICMNLQISNVCLRSRQTQRFLTSAPRNSARSPTVSESSCSFCAASEILPMVRTTQRPRMSALRQDICTLQFVSRGVHRNERTRHDSAGAHFTIFHSFRRFWGAISKDALFGVFAEHRRRIRTATRRSKKLETRYGGS